MESPIPPVPLTRHQITTSLYQGCSQKTLAPLATVWLPLSRQLGGAFDDGVGEDDLQRCITILPSRTAFSSSGVAHSTVNEPCFGSTVTFSLACPSAGSAGPSTEISHARRGSG